MKILNRTSAYIIVARNDMNNEFVIQSKPSYDRYLKFKMFNFTIKHKVNESTIIRKIREGFDFYTYNHIDHNYTEVMIVNNQLRTKSNNTITDNIGTLPIMRRNI